MGLGLGVGVGVGVRVRVNWSGKWLPNPTITLPPFTVTVTAHRSPLTFHPSPHPKQEPTDGAEDGDEDEEDEDDEEAVLGMWGAVFWLAVITVSQIDDLSRVAAWVRGVAVFWLPYPYPYPARSSSLS